MDKISVALATYNGESFIKEQLLSILTQSRLPDEIIISDNYSDDNTILICKEILNEYDVPYRILFEKQKNVVANFQNACKHCTGDIIFFCDQDDVWYKDKIKVFFAKFQEHPSCQMIFSDADLDKQNTSKTLMKELCNSRDISIHDGLQNRESFIKLELYKNIVTGMSMACRKKMIDSCIPFSIYVLHDYWIAINAACKGEVYYINKSTSYYRQHEYNTIGINKKVTVSSIKKSLGKNADKVSEMYLFLNQLKESLIYISEMNYLCEMIEFLNKRKDILLTKHILIGLKKVCKLRKDYNRYSSDPYSIYKDALNILMIRKG